MQTLINQDIALATHLLNTNQAVAIPTETVYGLAGNAFSEEAVAKIFAIKNRPTFNPLILHTHSLATASQFVQEIPPHAQLLAEKFWPGPLTLLLKKNTLISDLITADSSLVAIRIPNHPLTLKLLRNLSFPLVAPSANPFGYISPTSAQHVMEQLGGKIPLILDGGSTQVGIESTIIGFENNQPIIYRCGGISREAIEDTLHLYCQSAQHNTHLHAPGRLKSHYAPRTRLYMGDLDALLETHGNEPHAILSLTRTFNHLPASHQIQLSSKGSLQEAAHNLFASMRTLDKLNIQCILAEIMPTHGLGAAINDRLERAAHHE